MLWTEPSVRVTDWMSLLFDILETNTVFCIVARLHYSTRPMRFGSRGPFVSDTSPKCIDRENLGRRPTGKGNTEISCKRK